MDASGKKPGTKSNPSQQFREITDKATTQAHETYANLASATTEGSDALKAGCSTAIKGIQDYNAKVLEFAHANATAAFEFFQRMSVVKSPSEFVELSTEHAHRHFETLTDQTKQLVSLAQSASLAAVEPIKAGGSKAFSRAA